MEFLLVRLFLLLLTVLSLMLNIFRHAFLRRSFGSIILCAGTGMLVYQLIIYCVGLFLGFTTSARFTPTWGMFSGMLLMVLA